MLSLFVSIEHGLHKSPQPTSRLALEPILPVNLRLKPVPNADKFSGLQGIWLYSEQTGSWTHRGLVACSMRAEAPFVQASLDTTKWHIIPRTERGRGPLAILRNRSASYITPRQVDLKR